MRKISCAGQKHFDQLKSEPCPTYNSALRLPRWRWPVMRLWRLNVYGAIMSTMLLDTTILKSFWCSTMQSYQKLSTKVVSTLVLFVTTYLFESGFSSPLHLKKNKYRNRLNPSNDLCVGLNKCVKVWADNLREVAKKSLGWLLMSSKVWKFNSTLSAFCCVFSGPNVMSRAATSWYFRAGKWLYATTKFVFKLRGVIARSPLGWWAWLRVVI